MCGIIAYVGNKKATPVLIKGLKKLEYRGYDSAGIAVLNKNKIQSIKSLGKIKNLTGKIANKDISGQIGIAHTRWATHGQPCNKNSHPHSDCQGKIWLVHNGIIENYKKLKKELEQKGHHFKSQTDTEVIAHLIEQYCKKTTFEKAVKMALKKLEGTFGLAIISKDQPNKIIAAKKGSPLILGIGKNEFIIASDACAIANHTKKVIYLEDGEIAQVSKKGYKISSLTKEKINKKTSRLDWTFKEAQKDGFDHFMLKEIFEQPEAIQSAICGRANKFIAKRNISPVLGGLRQVENKLRKIDQLIVISCGTSYYAGLVGGYLIEELAGISTKVELASEFRYKTPVLDKKTAILAISQSGETADTLEAIKEAKSREILTLAITNVVGSSIAREVDAGVYNHAGPEVAVASTKAFTSQLSILVLFALMLGRQRKMTAATSKKIAQELKRIPLLIKEILKSTKEIKKVAKKYAKYNNWLYLGRKYNYPIALEGALKIKEISYVHAEGYASGEMKHGPIALVDKNFPSVFIAPQDSVYKKVKSGLEEIKARQGKIIAITNKDNTELKKLAGDVIYIPKTIEPLYPLLSVIPLQLLAYYVGTAKKIDVDKPKNLAKSVTVE